ncbi:hypothetical protein, partial [Latilactobacillus sakei]|uniref:hypothetical protein n=1 Tax=Latilactobacillus sakei TaxID=1599 RepID=UPI003F52B6BA
MEWWWILWICTGTRGLWLCPCFPRPEHVLWRLSRVRELPAATAASASAASASASASAAAAAAAAGGIQL